MRKRIGALFIILCLCTVAFAEGIDVSEMDLPELFDMHAAIDARIRELTDCGIDTNTIYKGEYVVGKDIAAGKYLFTCNKDLDDDHYPTCDFRCILSVRNDTTNDVLSSSSIYFEDSLSLTLEDGMVLRIDCGQASVQQLPTPDWAP